MPPRPTPAPQPHWTHPQNRRQDTSTLPSCVTPCITSADIGTCDSLTDLSCLCKSSVFITSVESCLATYCTTISDLQAGYDYADAVCLAEGVTIPATTITSANTLSTGLSTASAATITASGSSESAASTTTSAVAPVTTTLHDPTRIVDIAMSIVCAFLLAIAVAIAVWNFRARAAKDRAEAQARSWTGAGSTTGNTSFNGSKGRFNNGFSRSGQSQNKPRNLSHLDSSMFTRSDGFASNNNVLSLNRGSNGMEDYDDDLGLDSKYDLASQGRNPFGDEKRGNPPPRLSLNRTPIFKVSDERDGQEVTVGTIPELDEIESAEPSPMADSQFSAGASTTNLGEVGEEETLSRGKRMSGVVPENWGRDT